MLFAFAMSADEALSPAALAELEALGERLAREVGGPNATLGAQAPVVVPAGCVFWRGAQPLAERQAVLERLAALRALSARRPELTIMLSGWRDLPPTQLRAGEFELFGEAYLAALEALTPVSIRAPHGRVRR